MAACGGHGYGADIDATISKMHHFHTVPQFFWLSKLDHRYIEICCKKNTNSELSRNRLACLQRFLIALIGSHRKRALDAMKFMPVSYRGNLFFTAQITSRTQTAPIECNLRYLLPVHRHGQAEQGLRSMQVSAVAISPHHPCCCHLDRRTRSVVPYQAHCLDTTHKQVK